MKLKILLSRLFNGSIVDSLAQNFLIYFVSYFLSAFLSSIPNIGLLSSSGEAGTFFPAFSNCLLPTTVTLTVGTVIQNIAKAQELHLDLRISNFWPVAASAFYACLHVALSQGGNDEILSWVAIVSAFAISSLNLWTIAQIQGNSSISSTV